MDGVDRLTEAVMAGSKGACIFRRSPPSSVLNSSAMNELYNKVAIVMPYFAEYETLSNNLHIFSY